MAIPRPLGDIEAARSLAHKLGPVADKIRQSVAVKLGIRPYRVFTIRTRWTGGRRGLGLEEVVDRREILPAPRVELITNLQNFPFPAGKLERGIVKVDRVSTTLTEGDLDGSKTPGKPDVDENFYWEIEEDGRTEIGPNGEVPVRRRFRFLGAHRQADSAEWLVYLERMDEDRDRTGVPGSSIFPNAERP